MLSFIGKYDAKADVKGRVFVPSAYRRLLPEGEKERVVMRKDPDNECLIVYPESVWNKMLAEVHEKLNLWNPEDELLMMQFASEAEMLDIDAQGRILITRRNMQLVGVDNSEVLFVGMVDRFAIWSKAKFEQATKSPAEFAALLRERMLRKIEI